VVNRRYSPDPDALAAALAARVDRLEHQARQTGTDLAAIGRGLADLTAQIRRLTDHDIPPTVGGDDEESVDEAGAQPDWMDVDDAETAHEWLTGLDDWLTDVAGHHGLTVPAGCWLLHPDVVALLLAVQGERETAYHGQRPTPVTEWLTRWLPATQAAISSALAGCVAERGHRAAGRTYDTTGLDAASVAAWWATDRHTPAEHAFALPALH
jgi:hypothetical protein